MDGRGHYMDSICIERLWRLSRCEAPPLHGLTYGFITKRVIAEWIRLHSSERTCPAYDGRSPQEADGCCRPLDLVDQERALALVLQVE